MTHTHFCFMYIFKKPTVFYLLCDLCTYCRIHNERGYICPFACFISATSGQIVMTFGIVKATVTFKLNLCKLVTTGLYIFHKVQSELHF